MDDYNKGSHTVYDIKYHILWATKYRYKVLNKQIFWRFVVKRIFLCNSRKCYRKNN